MNVETCRICAIFYTNANEKEFLHIFEPHEQENLQDEQQFIIKVINAWNLNIAHNDGYPQRICANCLAKFSTINAFRKECETTQKLLREALQSQPFRNDDETEMIAIPMDSIFEHITDENSSVPSIVQEILPADQDVSQIETATVNTEPEISLNFKVSFDENAPDRIVINKETTKIHSNVVPTENASASTVKALQLSNNLNSVCQNNNQVMMSEDLEDMLTGSIIPKNIKKKEEDTLEKNSDEKSDSSDFEEDYNEEKPPHRLSSFQFACNYCYCPTVGPIEHLIFKNNEQLSQHFFDEHDPKAPYNCPKCPKLFCLNKRRNYHVSKAHNIGGNKRQRITCPYCLKVLRASLEVHENSCTYISDWRCRICDREFHQMPRHSFRAHQRTHNINGKLRCEICKRSFTRRAHFEAHKLTHDTNVPQRQWEVCIECDETFPTVNKLRHHEMVAHAGKAYFRCQLCDNGYATLAYLQRHISSYHSHRTLNSDETTCSNCKVTFPSKIKLYYHQQRQKDENGHCTFQNCSKSQKRPKLCPYCPRRFESKQYLDEHMEIHQSAIKPHKCEKCLKRFHTALGLKEHISATHSNPLKINSSVFDETSNFKCSMLSCSAEFSTEADLSQHLRSNHEPVACECCGEIYTRGELKMHKNSCSSFKNVHKNSNGSIAGSDIDLDSISSGGNSNVCVQYVNNNHQSISLKNNSPKAIKPKQNFLNSENVIKEENNENDVDYFISSLLDPDNEIVVT